MVRHLSLNVMQCGIKTSPGAPRRMYPSGAMDQLYVCMVDVWLGAGYPIRLLQLPTRSTGGSQLQGYALRKLMKCTVLT